MKNNNFLLVGSFVPEQYADTHPGISFAGNRYQILLKKMLNECDAFSIMPFFLDKKLNLSSDTCLYSEAGFKSYIYKTLFSLLNFVFRMRLRNREAIIVYNVELQNLLILIYLLIFFKSKLIVISADYITYKNSLLNFLIRKVYANCKGLIVLRESMKLNENQVLMPGLVCLQKSKSSFEKVNEKIVTYSGSIGPKTGLDLFVDTANRMADYKFFITGKPFEISERKLISTINKKSTRNNIDYLGALKYEDYIGLVQKSKCLLSLRDPKEPEHKFNFPSKIIEFISLSKIVISTIKYDELESDIYIYCDYDASKLENKIRSLDSHNIKLSSDKQKIYINNHCSKKALHDNINYLLTSN